MALFSYNHHKQRQNDQKCEVKGRKQQNVVNSFAFVLLGKFPEGNQTGQGCNQRTHAADVHAQKQIPVVFRELGEQNGRWDIADHLAGCHAEQ